MMKNCKRPELFWQQWMYPRIVARRYDSEFGKLALRGMHFSLCWKNSHNIRFSGFPSLIYLHKGKLYRFKGNRLFPHLKAFLLKGVPSMQGEIIPQPLGAMTEFIQTIKAAGVEFYELSSGKSGVAGIGIVILMTLFVGLILALVVMCFMPGSKSSKEKKS